MFLTAAMLFGRRMFLPQIKSSGKVGEEEWFQIGWMKLASVFLLRLFHEDCHVVHHSNSEAQTVREVGLGSPNLCEFLDSVLQSILQGKPF